MKGDLKQFPNAYLQSGDFYLRVNAVDEAIKQYEEGIQKDPSRKNTYLKHEIEAYVRSGKADLAYDKNELILKNDPKDPEARGLRATFMLDKGDVNNAMSELQSVVTAKAQSISSPASIWGAPTSPVASTNRRARSSMPRSSCVPIIFRPGLLRFRSRCSEATPTRLSIKPTRRSVSLPTTSGQGHESRRPAAPPALRRGSGLVDAPSREAAETGGHTARIGRPRPEPEEDKDAEDLFRRAWEADPGNLRGLLGESRAYMLDNQPEKSVQLIEAEAQKKPANLDLQRELGNAEVSAGQYDKAIGTYQALLAKVSEPRQQSDLWTRIGESYLRKGDIQQSINSLEKARQGQPNNTALTTNLGMLYEMESKHRCGSQILRDVDQDGPERPAGAQ